MEQKKLQPVTTHFCTYKNNTTSGWKKSREYNTAEELCAAMAQYIAEHPITTVQFQTRTAWF